MGSKTKTLGNPSKSLGLILDYSFPIFNTLLETNIKKYRLFRTQKLDRFEAIKISGARYEENEYSFHNHASQSL